MFVQLLIAFNLGLFSSLHCIGMCGGILSALVLAGHDTDQQKPLNKIKKSLSYNLGRIVSYSLAGLIVGFFSAQLVESLANINIHFILQLIAALVLIGIAFNIYGLLPFNRYLESSGMRLWRYIQPLGKHLLPINTFLRAFLFGMLWGWLPCGMVYSALILSLSSGVALDAMLIMFFFGLGTLPAMVSTGYFATKLTELQQNIKLRRLTASLLIIIAISLPLSSIYFSQHHHHHSNAVNAHQHHMH